MPKMRLTDPAIRRLPAPASGQVDHFDTVLPSFGVRTSASGRKSFFVMQRVNGKLRRFTLGRYPAMTLANARERAEGWKVVAERGLDPAVEHKAHLARDAARRANTYSTTVERFLRETQLRARTREEYARELRRPVEWLERPLESISRRDVIQHLDEIDARGTRSAVRHAHSYLRRFFNWCVDRGLIQYAPTDRLRQRHTAVTRERVLTAEELSLIVAALAKEDALIRDFGMLLLLTGQRRQEVAGLQWSHLSNLDDAEPLWTIPAPLAKNNRQHLVPLSPPVADTLRKRRATGKRSAKTNEREDADFILSRTGRSPLSGFSRAKARIDARITERLGRPIPHWTWHDLRRTMVTGMNEELGIAPHIVEAVVNHVSGPAKRGVAGVYNRALYLRERREALCAWADYVARIAPWQEV